MKLRIRGNSLRLRLTQSEVAKLAQRDIVEETTDFGHGEVFVYSIVAAENTESIRASFAGGRLEIAVPASRIEVWASSDEEGINDSYGPLKIAVEKDFACLAPRAPDEDADTFPHPRADRVC